MAHLPQLKPLDAVTASPTYDNSVALNQLARAIALSRGQFSLILACCDSPTVRQSIVNQLPERTEMDLWQLNISPSATTLLSAIEQSLQQRPDALTILGLESTVNLDSILRATNLARNEFNQKFDFPLVLWVNERILQKLRRIAPDFRSWAGAPIRFAANPLPQERASSPQPLPRKPPSLVEEANHWTEPVIRFERFEPSNGHRHIPPQQVPITSRYPSEIKPTSPNAIASELCVLEPHSLDDMEQVIRALRAQKSVILKMNQIELEEGQRALDFVVGGTYAIDGDQIKIAEALFVFTPSCVRLSRE